MHSGVLSCVESKNCRRFGLLAMSTVDSYPSTMGRELVSLFTVNGGVDEPRQ